MDSLPSAPQTIGQVLDSGFKLFRASFKGLAPVAFVAGLVLVTPSAYMVLFPEQLAEAIEGGNTTFWITFGVLYLASMAVYGATLGTMIHYCDSKAQDSGSSVMASVKIGLFKTLPMFIAFVGYMVATLIGSILLLVPGMILFVSLLFYGNCIVLEGHGPIAALRRSHRIVWGNWWRTFLLLSVVMVIYLVLYVAFILPLGLADEFIMASDEFGTGGFFSLLGETLAMTLGLPYVIATFVAMFYDLRLRSEGSDLASRVDALNPAP